MEDPRLILAARRPGGEDDNEQEVAAALDATKHDPALAEWAEKQSSVDRKISAALRAVQPPAGLRDRILAGGRASRPRGENWFERKMWGVMTYGEIAAIAAVVMLLGIAVFYNYFTQTNDERPWQLAAAEKAGQFESGRVALEHIDGVFETTVDWMREKACPTPAVLPAGLRGLGLYGCSVSKWNGKPIGIVCFRYGKEHEVHLVSIDAKNVPDQLTAVPRWTEVGGYTSAQWREGATVYMLLGKLPRTELEPLIVQATAAIRFSVFYFL